VAQKFKASGQDIGDVGFNQCKKSPPGRRVKLDFLGVEKINVLLVVGVVRFRLCNGCQQTKNC